MWCVHHSAAALPSDAHVALPCHSQDAPVSPEELLFWLQYTILKHLVEAYLAGGENVSNPFSLIYVRGCAVCRCCVQASYAHRNRERRTDM